MEHLLVDCNSVSGNWICEQEVRTDDKGTYYAWLVSGTFVKLVLTTVTFGCKVHSGVIIPALDAGALFGWMVGQMVLGVSPGIFAMVASVTFLAGVSRMMASLAVIVSELTGEVNFIPPFSSLVDTAPLSVPVNAPLKYAVEVLSKLEVRHVVVVDEDTRAMMGVVVKKRLLSFFDALR
ncbi:hypothetical protein VUR80DRAFT_9097 [Thermomyces stellatus]